MREKKIARRTVSKTEAKKILVMRLPRKIFIRNRMKENSQMNKKEIHRKLDRGRGGDA